jgi:hypothetical protein
MIIDDILLAKEINPDLLTIKSGQTTGIVSLVKKRKKRRKRMPIEYEMKYLYEVTADAISQYSEDHTSAYWAINIENGVLRQLLENNSYILSYFQNYQLTAMRELIRRGLWVKWCEKTNKPILSSDPVYKITIWDDTKPIPCGAD